MKQERLTKTRKMKGFSQHELAAMLNMEQTTYSRKERGIHNFTEREWLQLAETLETSVESLKGESIGQYNEKCTFTENSIGYIGVQNANIPKEMLDMMKKYIKLLEKENESLQEEVTFLKPLTNKKN